MKKILFVVALGAFAACGGSTNTPAATDTPAVKVDTPTVKVDTPAVKVDTPAASTQAATPAATPAPAHK